MFESLSDRLQDIFNRLGSKGRLDEGDVDAVMKEVSPVIIAQNAVRYAREHNNQVVIIDTAGRLQIDEQLMRELVQMKDRVHPTEVLLVVDAMTGQVAVDVAKTFNDEVGLTGLILT